MRLAESSRKGPPRHSIEKENRVSTFVSSTFVAFVIQTGDGGKERRLSEIADDKDRHLASASRESENRGAKRRGGKTRRGTEDREEDDDDGVLR